MIIRVDTDKITQGDRDGEFALQLWVKRAGF